MDKQSIAETHLEKKSFISAKNLSICLALLLVVFVAISVFRVPAGTLFWAGALLLCPLLHLFMMRDGGHKH